SEFIILVWTLLFGLVVVLYPRPLPMALITTLVVMSQIVVYGRIYLLFSTPSQLIAGAAVGFVEGCVYLILIALMRHYKVDRLLIAAPSILGYRFRDTIMYPNEPTLDTTRLPDKVVFKVYGGE